MSSTAELRDERGNLIHQARAIVDRATADRRDISREEQARFNRLMDAADGLRSKIDLAERRQSESRRRESGVGARAARLVAYRSWLRGGGLPAELRADQDQMGAEVRDTVLNNDGKGGFLIPPTEISADVVKALNDNVFIRRLATITPLREARALGVRKRTTRMADADWTTEVAAVAEDTTGAYGRRDMTPNQVSKLAKVSARLLNVASRPEVEIEEELADKFAITEERAYLTGSGSGRPLGVFVASANGIPTSQDFVAASATVFTADELINMKYTLRETYLNDPSLAWVVSREFVRRCRMLKVASTGGNDLEYLWQPGLTEGSPDKILDVPYHMSEFAPSTFTSGLYVAVLGAFRHYRIAEVESMLIQRLLELYISTNEVGFIGRRWVDGTPILGDAFQRLKLA